jgi:hypothetical protein
VPLQSAEHQQRQVQGGRQTGYERQHSDQNERALHSRLYRLVRIAQTMTWSK